MRPFVVSLCHACDQVSWPSQFPNRILTCCPPPPSTRLSRDISSVSAKSRFGDDRFRLASKLLIVKRGEAGAIGSILYSCQRPASFACQRQVKRPDPSAPHGCDLFGGPFGANPSLCQASCSPSLLPRCLSLRVGEHSHPLSRHVEEAVLCQSSPISVVSLHRSPHPRHPSRFVRPPHLQSPSWILHRTKVPLICQHPDAPSLSHWHLLDAL